jgi:hypothetical protein
VAQAVYIIDPRADVQEMVAAAREFSKDRGRIYYPHTKKQAEATDCLRECGSQMSIIPYDTINSEIDDGLFGFCQAIAHNTTRAIPEKHLRWSFYVLLQERMVMEIRRAEQLRYSQPGKKFQKFWLSTHKSYSLCQDVISAAYPDMIDLTGGNVRRLSDSFGRLVTGAKYNVPSLEQIRSSEGLVPGRSTVCVSTNMEDMRYQDAVLPTVERLLHRRNVVLLPARPAAPGKHDERLEAFGIKGNPGFLFIDQGTLTEKLAPDAAEIVPIIKAASPATDFVEYERVFGGVARDIVAASSLPLLAQCRATWPAAEALARTCDVFLLSPGRPLRSTITAAAAKASGKPTIELQSGTLSRNRRFIRPVADELLVIDDESKATYAYLGRTDRVTVIGGTKIDYALSSYRGMSIAEARDRMGLAVSGPLWMLASQPVGYNRMEKIARMVFGAAEKAGATVLIKMHPNETSVYEDMYRQAAAAFPGMKLIIDRATSAPLVVAASDVVLTHFSTVGIEAHILGKLTIAVNPFKEAVIFDIAAMGAAHPARTSRDILDIVKNKQPLTSENSTLTDGKSIDRCIAVIDRLLSVEAKVAYRVPAAVKTALKAPIPPALLKPHWLQQGWRRLPQWARVRALPLARRVKKLVDLP